MRQALAEARRAFDLGEVPIGAVVVWGDRIVGRGHNLVETLNDPTAHAEVNAIRSACRKVGSFKLDGCYVYSSCEPCPMCLSALYWAGVARIYYGNTKEDADAIDFSDKFIYEELERPKSLRSIPCIHVPDSGAIKAFRMWSDKTDKIEY